MVYGTKPYPAMIPYLKGFHLSLEMWRGGRDEEGWKVAPRSEDAPGDERTDIELDLDETTAEVGTSTRAVGPDSGITVAVP